MTALANYLRQNLLESLKERQRREGVEAGIAQTRSEADARWRAWNERREKAAERGEPFDEPPPYFDA